MSPYSLNTRCRTRRPGLKPFPSRPSPTNSPSLTRILKNRSSLWRMSPLTTTLWKMHMSLKWPLAPWKTLKRSLGPTRSDASPREWTNSKRRSRTCSQMLVPIKADFKVAKIVAKQIALQSNNKRWWVTLRSRCGTRNINWTARASTSSTLSSPP